VSTRRGVHPSCRGGFEPTAAAAVVVDTPLAGASTRRGLSCDSTIAEPRKREARCGGGESTGSGPGAEGAPVSVLGLPAGGRAPAVPRRLASTGQPRACSTATWPRYLTSFDRVLLHDMVDRSGASPPTRALVPCRRGGPRQARAAGAGPPPWRGRRATPCLVPVLRASTDGQVPAIAANARYGVPYVTTYGFSTRRLSSGASDCSGGRGAWGCAAAASSPRPRRCGPRRAPAREVPSSPTVDTQASRRPSEAASRGPARILTSTLLARRTRDAHRRRRRPHPLAALHLVFVGAGAAGAAP